MAACCKPRIGGWSVLVLLAGVGLLLWRSTSSREQLVPEPEVVQPARTPPTTLDEPLAESPARVSARASAHARETTDVASTRPSAPAGQVRGVVLWWGDRERPVAGARVRCTPSMGRAVDATTDAHGQFAVEDLAAGNVTVSATIEGGDCHDLRVHLEESGPGTSVSIEMMSTRELHVGLRGVVASPDDVSRPAFQLELLDRPLEIGQFVPDSARSHDLVSIRAAGGVLANGVTRVWDLQAHDVRPLFVALVLDGVVVDLAHVTPADEIVLVADTHRLSGRLGHVDVLVTEAGSGSPLAGVLVTMRAVEAAKRIHMGETDENGRMALDDLLAGKYAVEAGDGQELFGRTEVEIRVDARASAAITVDAGRVVSGTIEGRGPGASRSIVRLTSADVPLPTVDAPDLDSRGRPVVEAGPPAGYTRWTTGARRFTFVNVPPGRYVLTCPDGAGGTLRAEVDLTHGSVRDVVLRSGR